MVDELEAVFSEAFPVSAGSASFEFVSLHRLDAEADGFGAIRDIDALSKRSRLGKYLP